MLTVGADGDTEAARRLDKPPPFIVEREALKKQYARPDPRQILRRRQGIGLFGVADESAVVREGKSCTDAAQRPVEMDEEAIIYILAAGLIDDHALFLVG